LKLTYEDIVDYINNPENNNGCELKTTRETFYLEKEKQNKISSKVDLLFRCSCGNEFRTTFDKFKSRNKKQCNKCSSNLHKLSYETVKNYIEVESDSGCKLISEDYINSKKELLIQCSCGNNFKSTFNRFKLGKTHCELCNTNKSWNYLSVKNYIELESSSGYLLLSKDYETNKTPLTILCNDNHIFQMSFNTFKDQGSRCPDCGTEGHPVFTIEKVRSIFKENDCECLSNKYISIKDDLDYICSCGNRSKISLDRFLRGGRCKKCATKRNIEKLKNDYSVIKDIIEDKGCLLLSDYSLYDNNTSKLEIQCVCGNIFKTSLASFIKGTRCSKCGDKLRENNSMIKYGVPHPFKSPIVRKKIAQTCIKRYGFTNPMKNKKIREKAIKTLYENGTQKCSIQQKYINHLLQGELNYPVGFLSLDIAYPEDKLYIEYDGGLHKGNVIFGTLTEEQFETKERKRNYYLMSNGWKGIRIISTKDWLPLDKVIINMIEFAKYYLRSNHHYIKFDIDNSLVISSQFNKQYDYGELRRIKKSDLSIIEAS